VILTSSLLAALGLLLPVILFVGARSKRDREPWEVALDIPTAVSLDLLFVLTLALVVRLEIATLATRGIYLLAAAVRAAGPRRWRRASWPAALGRRGLACIAVAVLAGLALSVWMSRTWMIWDRGWHIPLVGSLRGQRVPFHNVFNASEVLHYHFSGDVRAAMLQACSADILHASLALSLQHDIDFALTALVLALFMLSWGYRALWQFVLGALALLLTGPAHLFRENLHTPQEGHSFVSYLSFSFRPHAVLAGLLLLGLVGSVVARLGARDDLSFSRTAPALVACTAGLAITEETSLGMLGVTLGLTWLYAPRVIHPRRALGVLVFVALAVALVVPNLVFSASLSPGAEHHVIRIVPWRSPGYYRANLPLTSSAGRLMLAYDLCSPGLIALGGVVYAWRRRGRGRGVLAAAFVTHVLLSTLALTRIDVDGQALESHRFATAIFIVGPFVALALLSSRFVVTAPARGKGIYAAAAMLGGMGFAAASTLDWAKYYAPTWASRQHDFGAFDFYRSSCREVVGDERWASARYTYVARPLYYLVTGCTPTYTPGYRSDSSWKSITIGLPYEQTEALARIVKQLPDGAPVPLVCPATPDLRDHVCTAAEIAQACAPAGRAVKRCLLPRDVARSLLPTK
jgi:hypothetical protein